MSRNLLPARILAMAETRAGSMSHASPADEASSNTPRVTFGGTGVWRAHIVHGYAYPQLHVTVAVRNHSLAGFCSESFRCFCGCVLLIRSGCVTKQLILPSALEVKVCQLQEIRSQIWSFFARENENLFSVVLMTVIWANASGILVCLLPTFLKEPVLPYVYLSHLLKTVLPQWAKQSEPLQIRQYGQQ